MQTIRMKEGFKGQMVISLPEDLLAKYAKDPLIGNLYIKKIGFFPKVKYHYVNKSEGCDYYTLIYCVDGKGWLEIEGKRINMIKNQYVILPADISYSFGASQGNPWTIYWVNFRGEMAANFCPSKYVMGDITPCEHSRIQDRIELFDEMYNAFSRGYTHEFMVYSSMCLGMFISSFLYLDQYRYIKTFDTNSHRLSDSVIRYMMENVERNISLDEFAGQFHYSVSHFSALFYKETGVSPINYFIGLKIRKACQYVELTNMKISEISTKLGFKEPAYFTRLFTKIMGQTPSEYKLRETSRYK